MIIGCNHGLYIDHWRSVDCLNWADMQTALIHLQNLYAMKAQRIRAIR